MGIAYTLNPRLVRGLDYYTKTTFEFWPARAGSQSSLGGGGRYDGLAQAIGGRPTPGIGVALGLERIILELKAQQTAPPAAAGPAGLHRGHGRGGARLRACACSPTCAPGACPTVMTFGQRSVKAQMKQAAGLGVAYVLMLGDDEVKAGAVTVRDMAASTQQTAARCAQAIESLAATGHKAAT